MAGELTVGKKELASLASQKGLGTMIKPLQREIHLFDTYVAGTTHLKDQSVLKEIGTGDTLRLQREDNQFDAQAIVLFAQSGKKAGYVPRKDNIIFSRLMDGGKLLTAKVKSIKQKGTFTRIDIGIYLIDF